MSADPALIDFIIAQAHNEFEKFIRVLEQVPEAAVTWQPAPDVHSIGWHARHALEWAYASTHVMIGGHRTEEKLYCLGWEQSPEVQAMAANPGEKMEPRFSAQELRHFAHQVMRTTLEDLKTFPAERYFEERQFPWGKARLLDELFENGCRHLAQHAGHILELKKAWSRRRA
jgi:DinB family protein